MEVHFTGRRGGRCHKLADGDGICCAAEGNRSLETATCTANLLSAVADAVSKPRFLSAAAF